MMSLKYLSSLKRTAGHDDELDSVSISIFRCDEFLHFPDDVQNLLLFHRHGSQNFLWLGVVYFLRLDEAEAGKREVVVVGDDFIGRHAPRHAVGGLALRPFFQQVGKVVGELRAKLARLFER